MAELLCSSAVFGTYFGLGDNMNNLSRMISRAKASWHLKTGWLGLFVLTVFATTSIQAQASDIQLQSVLVTLIEEREVPAQELGVLSVLDIREGDLVEEGAVLGLVDESEAKLAATQAEIEVDIAKAKVDSDIHVRFAEKSLEVAEAELRRATEAVEKYDKSISATEIDRLQLAAQRSQLEVEQAEHNHSISRFELRAKENQLKIAEHQLDRHRILAPISGVVVQLFRKQGEWVKPGDPVVRILRMNRLRAEGYLDSNLLTENLAGRPVTLTVVLPGRTPATFTGSLVFISPEISPVDGQVRVWAEIDNPELLLRPGLKGTLTIQASAETPEITAKKEND